MPYISTAIFTQNNIK